MDKLKTYYQNKILLLNKVIEVIKYRWKAESPEFFKELKKLSIKIGSSASAVVIINSTTQLNLNINLITVLSYLIAICAAIAGTSQLTVKSNT